MSETERRKGYVSTRVLIDAAKVLTPTFDDAVVYLTGAQLEVLRNLTQYANRPESYVAEYESGYYLTPDNDDWDDIQAIVADLEETLMGNPNTIFGLTDAKRLTNSSTVSGAGDKTLYTGSVPAGEVWRMEGWNAVNVDTSNTRIEMILSFSAGVYYPFRIDNPAIDEMVYWNGMLTMVEGDSMNAKFYGCADGDHIKFTAHGYIMTVPE